MKIVQSLWSKPSRAKQVSRITDVNSCGWPDKKYNYLSWVLSCLQLRQFYDEVELVTDQEGYELLINKLQLPYTHVKVELDKLNDYHPDLWALGKIYAYSIQEKPFIHTDSDVFIWRRFDANLEQAGLLCQSREEGKAYGEMYSKLFFPIIQQFEYYPEVLDRSIAKSNEIKAINAGILGGHDIGFYSNYTRQVFEFVDRNSHRLDKIFVSSFNLIFEQFLFRALADEGELPIHYFHPNETMRALYFDYTGVPSQTSYIHLSGTLKKDKYLVDCLEYRVMTDYPDYYYRLMRLIRTNEI